LGIKRKSEYIEMRRSLTPSTRKRYTRKIQLNHHISEASAQESKIPGSIKREDDTEEKYMKFSNTTASINQDDNNNKSWQAISKLILNKDTNSMRRVLK